MYILENDTNKRLPATTGTHINEPKRQKAYLQTCAQRRFRSVCAVLIWVFTRRILNSHWCNIPSCGKRIRLRRCAGWFVSSFGTCEKVCCLTLSLKWWKPVFFFCFFFCFFFSLRKHAYSKKVKILPPKKWKFFDKKNSDIFHISAQNIDCGYSLEPPRQGGSNEYPQFMFFSRNKKNNVFPCKPQFYYVKVGFKGVKTIHRRVFVMYEIG